MTVRLDLLGGIRQAVLKGESFGQAMTSFFNAGYSKQDIEDTARAVQYELYRRQQAQQGFATPPVPGQKSPVKKTPAKEDKKQFPIKQLKQPSKQLIPPAPKPVISPAYIKLIKEQQKDKKEIKQGIDIAIKHLQDIKRENIEKQNREKQNKKTQNKSNVQKVSAYGDVSQEKVPTHPQQKQKPKKQEKPDEKPQQKVSAYEEKPKEIDIKKFFHKK